MIDWMFALSGVVIYAALLGLDWLKTFLSTGENS